MSYIQLPYGNVEKPQQTIKLTNFPRNHNVSVLFPELQYLDNINDAEFQRSIIGSIQNRDDLQQYLLASSEIGQSIQDEIDIIYKNVMLKQNP